MTDKQIEDFKTYLEEIHTVRSIANVVYFDAATGAPAGGAEARAKYMGYISEKLFNLCVADEMKAHLEALSEKEGSLDDETKGLYRIYKKEYEDSKRIPSEMVREFSELRSKSHVVWEEARKENDFSKFAPYLEKIIKMQKDMLAYRQSDKSYYDLLLSDYEDGLTMEECDRFFAELKATIVPLLKKIMDKQKTFNTSRLTQYVSPEIQRKISKYIAEKVGYDLNRGLIRESAHPFCSGTSKYDVRITTHYHEQDFLNSFYSVLHESGHAIYEQNKNDNIANTALDNGISMGIHESQSRFYENVLGRSHAFWENILPELKVFLPAELQDLTVDEVYELINIAQPSLIRIEADELTYSLHIMVRYEMEKLMFGEIDINVNDLPRLWNEKYEEYLGIRPDSDANGILQDVHWSEGLMGYFPSYAIGSALSSQFMFYLNKEMDVEGLLRKGDIAPITQWLRAKIHQYGATYTPKVLLEKAIGEQLNAKYYTTYLEKKFGALYGV